MKKIAAALSLFVALCASAAAQTQFPTTLPANTVFGRTGVGPGPGQAIPINTFIGLMGGITGANISPGTIANSNLANAPPFTVKCNQTGSSATPSDCTTVTLNGTAPMTSGPNVLSLGTEPTNPLGNFLFVAAPIRAGATLNLSTNEGNGSDDEFMAYFQSNQVPTFTSLTTAAATASGTTLNFASVPANILAGMSIYDITAQTAINPSTKVSSVTATTIVLNTPVQSAVGNGDTIIVQWPNFKGPFFAEAICSDFSSPGSTACNAITNRTTIAPGNLFGFAEGIVSEAQDSGPGSDGIQIGGEIDIAPNNSTNSTHCDGSPLNAPCHTNIFVANLGTQRGSWMFESAAEPPGWNNGFSLRNIVSGGIALSVPNNTIIGAQNTGGTTVPLIFLDTNNNVNLGAPTGTPETVFNTVGIFNNSNAIKHLRNASCTTAATSLASCTGSVAWVGAFPNANYTMTCSIEAGGGVPILGNISSKTASGASVTILAGTAAAATGTIDCIGIHD